MQQKEFLTNLEYYKVFYYAAKYGSLTAAAERLFLTQPNVTKTIHRLEEQLNCTLFVRTKQGVVLTSEGEILWSRVEPACRMLLDAEQELEAVRLLEGGILRIASTEFGFLTYVLPTVQRFTGDHPNVKIKFYSALTGRIVEMLRAGTIDIAILHTPFQNDGDMMMYPIDVCRECLAVGPQYKALAEKTRHLAQLQEYPFVSMPEGSATKTYLSDLFLRQNLSFEADFEVTTTELAIQAVKNNFGIGLLPCQAIGEYLARGEMYVLPLENELPEREVFALMSRSIPASSAARTYLNEYMLKTRWEPHL